MTRKDFRLIAEVLRTHRPETTDCSRRLRWDAMVRHFLKRLEEANPLFDAKKFVKASGYQDD